MISENIIKTKFIVDTLRKGADLSFNIQEDSFNKLLHRKSGATIKSLTSPQYTIAASGSIFQVVSNVTKQLRFQDLGVRKLYTIPLFSALKKTYASLRYGLTEEIRESIREELQQSFDS
jgi:hypothetical protein